MAAILFRLLLCLVLCQHVCLAWRWLNSVRNVLRNERCFPDMYREFRCYRRTLQTNWHLPRSPQDQRIRFELYTPAHRSSPQILDAMDVSRNRDTRFDVNGQVAVVIHGFTQSSTEPWVRDMVRQLLTVVPNVIALDWSRGARPPNYAQAVANTRVVGAHLATLIRTLGVRPGRVHLIGHSLGAQVAGFAGAKFGRASFSREKIGRITGLDPAGPWYEMFDDAHKLDPSDAIFVDVIHTDSRPIAQGGLGVCERTGHVDFHPNGGSRMPGCGILGGPINIELGPCSHRKAVEYFTASIGSNGFTAYPCATPTRWRTCTTCSRPNGCNRMGYHATPSPDGLFVLRTGATYPFTT